MVTFYMFDRSYLGENTRLWWSTWLSPQSQGPSLQAEAAYLTRLELIYAKSWPPQRHFQSQNSLDGRLILLPV